MSHAVVELENVWKVFGSRAEEAMATLRSEGIGKAEVLERYNAVVGVKDASFSVAKGEIFCLMGLLGSGKSTLVRQINRLIEPTAGTIRIMGQDIGAMNSEQLRATRADKIGMVFQNMALLPHRSVRDNIGFALELRGMDGYSRAKAADQALETVSLHGYGDRLPSELSSGMQQRVGLARALAADPEILLMDEPFSALDPLIRRNLQDEFLGLSQNLKKTTVFITHDLDKAIRMGDRIGIMKDGEIVQIGTAEDIVTAPADDYVADFVAGISRLKLVSASKIMVSPEQHGPLADAEHPVARPDDDLDTLVGLSTGSTHPVLIKDGDQLVGVVSKDNAVDWLARGIRDMSGAEEREVIDRDVTVATFVQRGEGYYSNTFERIQKGSLPLYHLNIWELLVPWLWSAWRGVWLMFWVSLPIDVLALVCLMQVVKFSPLLAEAMLDPEANRTLVARYSRWITTYSWCAAVLFIGGRLWIGSIANRWYYGQYARWRIDDIVPSGTVVKRLVLGLVIIAIVAPITTYRATQLRLDERACFNQIRAAEGVELLLTRYTVADIDTLAADVRTDANAASARFEALDAIENRTAGQNSERSAVRAEARDLNRSADLVDEYAVITRRDRFDCFFIDDFPTLARLDPPEDVTYRRVTDDAGNIEVVEQIRPPVEGRKVTLFTYSAESIDISINWLRATFAGGGLMR